MKEFHVQEVIEYKVYDSDGYEMDSFDTESEADDYRVQCEQEASEDEEI